MLTLDAASIGEWQSCRRRYVLSRAWRPLRWRPKALFDACLRQGILAVSQGDLPAPAAAASRSQFLQSAANPGLDITTNPYLAAKDWCAMLDTILLSLTREGIPSQLAESPPIKLNSMVSWAPLAHVEGQTLHRWLTLDHWGEEDMIRELHSWRTLGDVAMTKLPMIIHVIEVGQVRNGRRASAWTRAWKHPTMPSLQMRFKGKLPGAFKGWKPLYFSDAHVEATEWVEQMWKEGAARGLIHHVRVNVPSPAHCVAVEQDILSEAMRIHELSVEQAHWTAMPMSRNACDQWTPCSFQPICYADGIVQIEKLGNFKRRLANLGPRAEWAERAELAVADTAYPS